ncbi:MAG: 50S ribosomal protein L18 [Parcubacteria group bacterium]|nr:50S ribosomal protein L18 [Parcubacteria group bacterium]
MKISFQKTKQAKIKRLKRIKRHNKIRSKVIGSAKRPRMSFFRSNVNNYVQIIDDEAGKTLVSASDKEIKADKINKTEKATKLGELVAKRAKDKKIVEVVFDRGGYKYSGRVKAFADSARSGGLKF